MTAGLPLIKSVLTPLAKNILLPIGLSVAISETTPAIQKNHGSGTTALDISNKEIEDIVKIVNTKTAGGWVGVNLIPPSPHPSGFSKNVSSKDRVKPWFFVTFNIIISQILSWKFYWNSSNRSEVMNNFSE